MASKRKLGGLEDREVSVIKGMMYHKAFGTDQEILAHFSNPRRTVNNGRLSEIRRALEAQADTGNPAIDRFRPQPIASRDEINAFLAAPPRFDPRTGLDLVDDELVIKAREAMLLAVQGYNSAAIRFKAETFIVLSIIAWTYLMLAHYRKRGIDCVYRDKNGNPETTPHGQPKYLELGALLKKQECPLTEAEKTNLEYLLGLRHEIEHRGTQRIDDAISAKLHACALNFNATIKKFFGPRCGLDHEIGFAIQFARLDPVQRRLVSAQKSLPKVIETYNLAFEKNLSEDILKDPRYAYRVAIVPCTVNRRGQADDVYETVDPRSPEGQAIAMIFKDREKPKFRPKDIVEMMRKQGYRKFRMHDHTTLWQAQGAKDPGKGYGVEIAGTWYWYQSWVDVVCRHCEERGDRYR
ncbi:MAG: hypothetical protein KatS3mg117_1322 [Geminicoccaceae bacterium]|jgi:hypothetical protein|nr:MAG: hypothetical protein KatS3mg117_1322 [Geminicoccaceae bacterium]